MAAVIDAIRPEQASLPTPCTEWDVRFLVRHVAARDLRNFIVAAHGDNVDWLAPPDELPEDWSRAFRDGAQLLMETWRSGDPDRPVPLPGGGEVPLSSRADQQIAELVVHAWDLVKATGQGVDGLDPALAERALAWSHRLLRPEHRGPGKAFGVEVPVPEDAPILDRLAGWFGRDPGWTPADA
jgi:uncharacterized protein (TIGR03086 family)